MGMDQNFVLAHRPLGWALAQKGQYSEATTELKKAVLIEPRSDLIVYRAYVYARSGRAGEARKTLGQLKRPLTPGFEVIAAYVALGEKDAAFFWLEKAFKERSGLMVFLRTAPEYDPLRNDPRFQDLLRRVGLATEETRK